MNNKQVSLFVIAAWAGLLASCGQTAKVTPASVRNSAFVVRLSDNAMPAASEEEGNNSANAQTVVSGSDGVEIVRNNRFYLTTVYDGSKTIVPEVVITLDTPLQKNVAAGRKKGDKIDWEITLPHGDGEYTIYVNVVNAERFGLKDYKPWSKKIRLDTTPPQFRMEKTYKESEDGSERRVSIKAIVEGERESVQCKARFSSAIGKNKPNVAEVGLNKENDTTFSISEYKLPEDLDNYFFVKVACRDFVGNEREIGEELSSRPANISFTASVVGKKYALYENSENPQAPMYVFARTGSANDKISTKFKLNFELINKNTGKSLSDNAIAREKSMLRAYVTDYEVKSVDDLNQAGKVPYLGVSFNKELDVNIPAKHLGLVKLYVSLTQLREEVSDASSSSASASENKDGAKKQSTWKEVLLGVTPIELYVQKDGDGLEYVWRSDAQFISPTQNAEIALDVIIAPKTKKGAPLGEKKPVVEYTTNDTEYVKIENAQWELLQGVKDGYRVKFRYPFANERPFRVRLVGENVAGVQTVSGLSKNLIAKSPLVWVGQESKGQVAVGSSYLCKIGDRYYASVLVKRGDTPIDVQSVPIGTHAKSLLVMRGNTQERVGADKIALLSKKGDIAAVFYGAYTSLGEAADAARGIRATKIKIPALGDVELDFSSANIDTSSAQFECE